MAIENDSIKNKKSRLVKIIKIYLNLKMIGFMLLKGTA